MADNNTPCQAGVLALSGSGVSATATSVQVAALKKPGTTTNITMSNFGDTGYGAFEPNTSRWENFSFTGITQNADGTATFTGVTRGLDFVSPYAADATLRYAHAGGTEVIITNTGAFYNEFAIKDNDETITGQWTYPIASGTRPRYVSSPTFGAGTETHLIDKNYADGLAIAGAPDASTTQKGLVEEATQAEVEAGTAAGSAARLFTNPSTLAPALQKNAFTFAIDAGATDAYAITLVPAITAYAAGQTFSFDANTLNTGAATLNVNALGVKNIKKYANGGITDLETGDIVASQVVIVQYDGTQFILQSPSAGNLTTAAADEAETFFGATNITGAEAETLSDASNADALHVHTPLVGFFVTESPIGGSEDAEELRMIVADGSGNAYITRNTGAQLNIYRMQRDATSRLYYNPETNVGFAIAAGGTECNNVAVGASFVWACGRNGAGTDIVINRWDKDLTNSTNMTISGAANANVITFIAGDDSTLYCWRQGAAIMDIYTISGTTATRGATVTFSDAMSSTGTNALWFDGTNFYTVNDSAGRNQIKKYNVTGTLQSTTANGYFNGGNATTQSERGLSRGLIPAWTGALYLVGEFTISDDATGVLSTEWRFYAIAKP